ncbi:HLA class II histocompatibility antigen, DO alpha chain [Galemys pyrenaicus]|uniref:HLA class II histocompatibility antigen, DO alpha chain n=1 Tax=Galemys pyrenaicus TaxID=202257 RepID=A0A8J6DJU6_GALPY|nr:HLA class II histocompatibility antigen, DO alpha chain [Galemys pyrenaicus]
MAPNSHHFWPTELLGGAMGQARQGQLVGRKCPGPFLPLVSISCVSENKDVGHMPSPSIIPSHPWQLFHSSRASSVSELDSVPHRTRIGHRLRDNSAHIVNEINILFSLSLTLNVLDTADHMGSYGPAFYQSYDASGQFAHEFDGEQLFSVDLKKKEAVWRLPQFGDFTYFDPMNALRSIAMIEAHLDILVERSNRTRATTGTWPFPCHPTPSGRGGPRKSLPHFTGLFLSSAQLSEPKIIVPTFGIQTLSLLVPPRVTVLPKSRVELGQPNVLMCIVDNIFPPVINITWLRNGRSVTEGVIQTSFYSQPDHTFRKFHYLTFVPSADDFYDCKVEHWGLPEPLFVPWGMEALPAHPPQTCLLSSRIPLPTPTLPFPLEPQVPAPRPDTMETLVCALGLAFGLLGFLVGTILIIKGTCLSSAPRFGDPGGLRGGRG